MDASPHHTPRTPRVLACVLCQTRKIKCDRNSPCANCVKANVKCTPSTPAPARKRRRPNQDLQQRLARCEELLSEYAAKKPEEPSSEGEDTRQPWRPTGQLIIDDGGGVKFMDSYLCATIHDELRAMRDILDDEDKDDEYYTPKFDTPTNASSPDQNSGLILTENGDGTADGLHPLPAHVFSLWQTFLERINPLTKVIHVPSVQPLVVDAATGKQMPKNVEALLFSIYLMATVSMSEEECLVRLGSPKKEAIARFSNGVRITLMRVGILKSHDITVLQALVLFMLSLLGRYDKHAAWILNGTVVRIAQKMGLHHDGERFGLSPFDSEIRRRIWWQIVMLDATYALVSGLSQSILTRGWSTRTPANLHDADLSPTMTSVESKEVPTDMAYCLVSYEMGKMLIGSSSIELAIMRNERATVDALDDGEVAKARKRIDEAETTMNQILEKYSDPAAGPIYELSKDLKNMIITRLRALVCPPQDHPEWGTELFTPKDYSFKMSVTTCEDNVQLYRSVKSHGPFVWFVMSNFQIDILIYMVGQLSARKSGYLVERAWAAVEALYELNTAFLDLTDKAHMALAIHTLRAWRGRRERITEMTGAPPEVPQFILNLETLLPKDDSRLNTPLSTTALLPYLSQTMPGTGVTNPAHGLELPWEQMMFMESGTMDWTMLGDGTHGTNGGMHDINGSVSGHGPLGPAYGVLNNGWT